MRCLRCGVRAPAGHGRHPHLIALITALWLVAKLSAKTDHGLYLLCYDPKLQPAAEAWAAYRAGDGWQVVTTPVAPCDDPAAQREALRKVIRGHVPAVDETRASIVEPASLWASSPSGASAGQLPGARAVKLSPQSSVLSPLQSRLAVLLLGDADAIAPWSFPQTESTLRSRRDSRYVTDNPYQDVDDDGMPDVALGRVPARTNEEALITLDKVRRYEANRAPGSWRRRIEYVAGEGRFGPWDGLLEQLFKQMVARFVPEAYEVTMTYANPRSAYCPPPSLLSDIVLDQLSGGTGSGDGCGALLFNYIGHGHATALDELHWNGQRVPILRSTDMDRLPAGAAGDEDAVAHGALPIALLTCCSAGWFDLDGGRQSLAEAMLFHPVGPVAVIAGSRMTHPYANTLMQKNLTQRLLGDDPATLGDVEQSASRALLENQDDADRQLDLIAQPIAMALGWSSSLPALRAMHVELYNLLGDPALRVARPAATFEAVTLSGDMLRGRVNGMTQGSLRVEICAARTAMARPEELVAVTGEADPQLERKAAHNYALANERMLGVLHGEVREGEFALAIPREALARGAAALRIIAAGSDRSGQSVDAYGGLDLPIEDAPSRNGPAAGDSATP